MPLVSGQILQSRYRILRPLGQGGMGAVYLAEHTQLAGRRFAIKENIPDPNASPQALAQRRQQFLTEAQVLASLDHPHLPKVSDFFSEGGNEYLVMDFVEGLNLEEALHQHVQQQGKPLPEKPVLLWARQVLDALEYLHNQSPHPILHRDLKPANIVLTPQGKIKLVDFGLVKLFDPARPGTATAIQGMGTPEYTPLEQYGSSVQRTDARTDVYALGATLYHLLTGGTPPPATERVLDPARLQPPRHLNPALSAGTEAALLKALALDPNQRFWNAAEMRAALTPTQVFFSPVRRSHDLPTPAPTARPSARVPLELIIVTSAVLIIASLIIALMWMGTQDRPAPSITPSATEATPILITANNVARLSEFARLPQRAQEVAFAPDGQTLALAGIDGIALWNPGTISQTGFITASMPSSIAFGPDGRQLLISSKDGRLQLWDLLSHNTLADLEGHTATITDITFDMTGALAASSSQDSSVRVWDVSSYSELFLLAGHVDWALGIAFSPVDGLLASAGRDAMVQLWDTRSGAIVWSFQGHEGPVSSVAISPDGNLLASGGEDNTIRLWDLENYSLLRILVGHLDGVTSVEFGPDRGLLASGSKDGTIRLWETESGVELRTLKAHNVEVVSMRFDPAGNWIASVGSDGMVTLWGVK